MKLNAPLKRQGQKLETQMFPRQAKHSRLYSDQPQASARTLTCNRSDFSKDTLMGTPRLIFRGGGGGGGVEKILI